MSTKDHRTISMVPRDYWEIAADRALLDELARRDIERSLVLGEQFRQKDEARKLRLASTVW